MKKQITSIVLVLFTLIAYSCNTAQSSSSEAKLERSDSQYENFEKAYFASGCFWCVEAIFESVVGVEEVVSGYAGGSKETANYGAVCSGTTQHAESVLVYYDPLKVSYTTLLDVFFASHDPTTLNRQGPDAGPQYRSAIFYTDEVMGNEINSYIKKLKSDGTFNKPITTEVSPLKEFYPAEDYHQNYERNNPNNSYVQAVSIPRLNDFKRKLPNLLKENH